MESTSRRPRAGAMVIALPMLFFGCLMFLYGYADLIEWPSERAALIACSVVLILAGSAVFGCALWLFGSLGRSPLALRIGGTGIMASGAVLATAAAVGVLQCSGPT
jgi:hypothetical protein